MQLACKLDNEKAMWDEATKANEISRRDLFVQSVEPRR
jgi:hypothetical protein